MLVFGTTVSLVLTFGTAQFIEIKQRAKDRRLTALMVMSNIEAFAQQLDTMWIQAAYADTATAWLLNIPKDSLDEMDQDDFAAHHIETQEYRVYDIRQNHREYLLQQYRDMEKYGQLPVYRHGWKKFFPDASL